MFVVMHVVALAFLSCQRLFHVSITVSNVVISVFYVLYCYVPMCGECRPPLAKANPVQIRSLDPDKMQDLVRTSLFKDAATIKFSWRSGEFFLRSEIRVKLWEKYTISPSWRKLQRIPRSGSRYRWLPKFNPFFLVQT